MSISEDLGAEFDMLAARAGLAIPAERRDSILALYAEMKGMTAKLREAGITPADEPANIYLFDPILRSA
jgi:hypothetical protein